MTADDVPPEETLAHLQSDGADWISTVDVTDEGLRVGDQVTFSKPMTEADVERFAAASGDTNPLHFDRGFAERTRFDEPVVHGVLVVGLVSAALARLPGLVIYLSQDVSFVGPVPVNSVATASVEVVDDLGEGRYRLATEVIREDGDPAVEGEAVVLIEEPPTGTG
ncbi:MAG: MaoC/PaaZ C-terminal domain-containing protein [Halobacteriales archaeon]